MRTFMIHFVLLLGALTCHNARSQNQWKGDTTRFRFESDGIFSQLNPDQSSAEIYTERLLHGNCSWEWSLQMDFNPSSNNHVIVYLNCNPSSKEFLDGYFLAIGKNKDAIQFFVRKNGVDSLLMGGFEKELDFSPIAYDFKITRSANDQWQLFSKPPDLTEFVLKGSVTDAQFTQFYTFSINCVYTKTRVDKFNFSNIRIDGEVFEDTMPPKLLHLDVLNSKTLVLYFNENVLGSEATFSILQPSIAAEEVVGNAATITITLAQALENKKSYTLKLENVSDDSGNILTDASFNFDFIPFLLDRAFVVNENSILAAFSKPVDTLDILNHVSFQKGQPTTYSIIKEQENTLLFSWDSTFQTNQFYSFKVSQLASSNKYEVLDTSTLLAFHDLKRGDLVLNEIMADPNPPVELPEAEYIEIYNNSEYDISLLQFQLYIHDKTFHLSEFDIIPPLSYCIVVDKSDLSLYRDHITTASTQNAFSLLNSGFELAITTPNRIIDYLDYRPDIIFNDFKSAGGWSVERLDNESLVSQNNWEASENSSGGTPGSTNSVYGIIMDDSKPTILYFFVNEDTSISVIFSEEIEFSSLLNGANFKISDLSVALTEVKFPSQKAVKLTFSKPIEPNKTYTLQVNSVSDLSGNLSEKIAYSFRLPEKPETMDISFNEIMFEPLNGCAEYIEFYNRSEKFINLSELILTENDENGNLQKGLPIFEESLLMAPKSYLIVTNDNQDFELCYPIPDSALHVASSNFPTLNNDGQNLALVTLSGEIIDELTFSKNWHAPLMSETKGVALEKLHPNLPSAQSNSWTSAASLSGFATPGSKNSQYISPTNSSAKLSLLHENISPNNDGYKDGLTLQIPQNMAGYSISVQVFDVNGRYISELCNNYFLGTQSTFLWNDFTHEIYPSGIYAVRIRGVHPNGDTTEEFLPFAISFK